jgi:hypothetical protein
MIISSDQEKPLDNIQYLLMAKQTNKKLKKPEMGRNLNKGGD